MEEAFEQVAQDEAPSVLQEDLENAVAAAELAFIQGRREPVVAVEDRRRRSIAFEKTAKIMLRYRVDSEDLKVGVTELKEQVEKSEEAGVSIRQIAKQAIASLARWNAQLKGLVELKRRRRSTRHEEQVLSERHEIFWRHDGRQA